MATDGSYHALLFNGNYQIIFPIGVGPFRQIVNPATGSDTINVKVRGKTKQNIKVTPYFAIQNVKFSVSGRTVNATINLKRIINNSKIQYIALYVGKTKLTNNIYFISNPTKSGGSLHGNLNNIHFSAQIPKQTPKVTTVFANVGFKIQNVANLMFSKTVKLQLQ